MPPALRWCSISRCARRRPRPQSFRAAASARPCRARTETRRGRPILAGGMFGGAPAFSGFADLAADLFRRGADPFLRPPEVGVRRFAGAFRFGVFLVLVVGMPGRTAVARPT